jgi:DNA-binding NarL/FixJ family response regulator
VISVLVADDQAIVREGLRVILDAQDDVTVVGEAGDGIEVLARTREHRPDLVLMDIQMPRMDGIEATRRLLARDDDAGPAPRVLVLTTFGEDRFVFEALRAGASGFLLKDARRGQLLTAVRTVAAGDEIVDAAITRRLVEQLANRPRRVDGTPEALAALSGRELEVLRLVAAGLSNAEIAAQLVLADATVKTHVASILRKLDARDRVQLVIRAYETGLVAPESAA